MSAAVACVLFVGVLVTFPGEVVDRQKSPRELVRASGAGDPTRDQRLASYRWFQPSVVYYTGREVAVLESPEAVAAFLAVPTPGYLFVPEPVWREYFADRVRFRTASRPGTTISWRSATCWSSRTRRGIQSGDNWLAATRSPRRGARKSMWVSARLRRLRLAANESGHAARFFSPSRLRSSRTV